MPANKNKIWITAAAVLMVIVAADLVCMFSKCNCKAEKEAEPEVTSPAEPVIPSAQERTASKVAARLADKEYMGQLKTLENRQQELAVARTKILAEFKAWHDKWITENPEAKAISDKINAYIASKNGKIEKGDKEFEALEAELKKLILADPVGAEIQGRLDAIAAEEAEHHNLIVAVIGSRLRQDMNEGAKAESLAAEQWRKEHAPADDLGRGHPKKKPLPPGYSNDPDPFSKPLVIPQGMNVPTNFPGYKAPTNAVINVEGNN